MMDTERVNYSDYILGHPTENKLFGIAYLTSPLRRKLELSMVRVARCMAVPMVGVACMAVRHNEKQEPIYLGKRWHPTGEFYIQKVKTMVDGAEASEPKDTMLHDAKFSTENDPRITRTGRFLRRLSIDELPQLNNVVDGSMSLIGGRPLAGSESEFVLNNSGNYTKYLKLLRLGMKFGMIGISQIPSRKGECTFEDRIKLETRYGEEATLGADWRIFAATIRSGVIFKGK